MSDEEPRVRVELGSDIPLEPSHRARQARSPRGPLVLMVVLLIGTFGILNVLSSDGASTPDPADQARGVETPDNDVSNDERPATAGSALALTSDLAAQIDAYDRVTYTSISPELRSIVRDADEWISIDDLGLISHSPNLLSWVAKRELRGQVAIALAATDDGPLALTTTDSQLRVIRVADGFVEQAHPVLDTVVMGALAPDGRWAAVTAGVERWTLIIGTPDGSRQTIELDTRAPTSVAVTTSHVVLTIDELTREGEVRATSLLTAPLSQAISAPDGSGFFECALDATSAVLVTTGDSAVHLVEENRAWVASEDGDRFELVVDASLLPTRGQTVRPIATGIGWSVANTQNTTDEPVVWITRDGETYEPQRVPSGHGRPGHVIWAYLGGSEGVGVRVSDTAAETGLLRIGDVRARHPRPHELSRNVRIERPDMQIDLRRPDCEAAST